MAPILILLLLPLAVNGLAVPWARKGGKRFELQKGKCEAFRGPSPDVASENYLSLSRADNLTSRSSTFFDNVRRVNNPDLYAKRDALSKRQVGQLSTALGGAEYIVDIQFGGTPVKAILDTGSSDTWLVQDGFTCTDTQGNPVDASQCKFGPTYGGGFDQIPDENFMVGYGNGEFVTGNMGYQDVTIGGITVSRAKVALATRAYWIGDNVATGLVGLAYSLITSAYKGNDPSQNSPSTRVPYDPLFTTMWKQGSSSPVFSLALQRGSGGYIAFGGLPPVQVASDFATTALQEFKGLAGSAFTGQSFYTITPDALIFPGAATRQTAQFIIDSGTTLNHLPTTTARAINSLFSPRAVQTSDGVWTVACNARAPQFGVRIGGQPFYINPVDMIFRDEATGVCVSAIQDGGAAPGPFVLGDQFLNGVVAVFDVGAAQMRFAVHNY